MHHLHHFHLLHGGPFPRHFGLALLALAVAVVLLLMAVRRGGRTPERRDRGAGPS